MPTLIEKPTVIAAAGNKPKTIEEYAGRVNSGHASVSVAIQAYLKRSLADVASLLPLAPAIRVCTGIYSEPPEIAYRDRASIRGSYKALVKLRLWMTASGSKSVS